MSKQVVTKVDYSYGSLSGNVNYLSISTGWALDSSDMDTLREEIKARDNKIEEIEKKIKKVEESNEILINIFKDMMRSLEEKNANLVHDIINISEETRERVLEILLNHKYKR